MLVVCKTSRLYFVLCKPFTCSAPCHFSWHHNMSFNRSLFSIQCHGHLCYPPILNSSNQDHQDVWFSDLNWKKGLCTYILKFGVHHRDAFTAKVQKAKVALKLKQVVYQHVNNFSYIKANWKQSITYTLWCTRIRSTTGNPVHCFHP